jgi:hypothetical protein
VGGDATDLGLRPHSPKTFVRFYKAVVMNVLLYRSETWKVTEQTVGILEAFRNKCVRTITRQPVRQDIINSKITWIRPPIAPLLAQTKLQPLAHYIRARQANLTVSYRGRRPEDCVNLSNRSYVLKRKLFFEDI